MKTFSTSAIIIHRSTFFEKDKRIECISPEYGKITCLAKSAALANSKSAKSLEPLTHVKLYIYKGRSFNLLNHVDILDGFLDIRTSFNHLQMGLWLAYICKKTAHENHPCPGLFQTFLTALKKCNTHDSLDSIQTYFSTRYIQHEGIGDKHLNKHKHIDVMGEYLGERLPERLRV